MNPLQKPTQKNDYQYSPEKIVRVQAQSNYCKIHFTNQTRTLVVSKVLHLVQKELPEDMFVRIHRSHLINKCYIKNVLDTHSKMVELTNGEFISVSRRKRTLFPPQKD